MGGVLLRALPPPNLHPNEGSAGEQHPQCPPRTLQESTASTPSPLSPTSRSSPKPPSKCSSPSPNPYSPPAP